MTPAELAATPFQREERFIVVKRKHLVGDQEERIRSLIHDELGIQTVECVVVESDWPEYETVWAMIEARCTGRTTPPVDGELADLNAVSFARLWSNYCAVKAERDSLKDQLTDNLAAERRGMERAAKVAEGRYERDADGHAAWWRGDNNAASLAIAHAIRKEAANLTGEQAHDQG